MKLFLRIVLLIALVSGTLTQEFNLADAFDDPAPVTTPKPKPDAPKVEGGGGGFDGFDLSDALKPDPQPKQPDNKPKSGGGSDDLDLFDALGPDPEPKPDKPAVNPNSGGGGGTLSDDDLFDITGGGGGSYKPEGGRPGGGGQDPGYDPHGNADQPQDPELPVVQILKMLNANMPEEFFTWISNVKQTMTSLLERALDLLRALP